MSRRWAGVLKRTGPDLYSAGGYSLFPTSLGPLGALGEWSLLEGSPNYNRAHSGGVNHGSVNGEQLTWTNSPSNGMEPKVWALGGGDTLEGAGHWRTHGCSCYLHTHTHIQTVC